MRRSKTIGLLAFVAGATALLYKPALKLIRELSGGAKRPKRAKKTDDGSGKFANHYLGSNRHHARTAKHHKSASAS